MYIDVVGILLGGVVCAIAVRFFGGRTVGGFVAGVVPKIVMGVVPAIVTIFPFAFIIIPIAILAILVYFLGRLDVMRSITVAIITAAALFAAGFVLALLPISPIVI